MCRFHLSAPKNKYCIHFRSILELLNSKWGPNRWGFCNSWYENCYFYPNLLNVLRKLDDYRGYQREEHPLGPGQRASPEVHHWEGGQDLARDRNISNYCERGGSDRLQSGALITMAASAKSERDNAASVLRQALRRLDSLTKEKQIKAAMVTAEQQYAETIRLHIQYCSWL